MKEYSAKPVIPDATAVLLTEYSLPGIRNLGLIDKYFVMTPEKCMRYVSIDPEMKYLASEDRL